MRWRRNDKALNGPSHISRRPKKPPEETGSTARIDPDHQRQEDFSCDCGHGSNTRRMRPAFAISRDLHDVLRAGDEAVILSSNQAAEDGGGMHKTMWLSCAVPLPTCGALPDSERAPACLSRRRRGASTSARSSWRIPIDKSDDCSHRSADPSPRQAVQCREIPVGVVFLPSKKSD